MTSAWVTMSSSRPQYSDRSTWLNGSGRRGQDPGLAHPLGHRPDLALTLREQHDDAVGLAELPGARRPGKVHSAQSIRVRRQAGRLGD